MNAIHHRYEIRVAGRLGEMILSAFPDLHAESECGHTVLVGSLPDRSALYGVVARLESLGLDLVDIHRLPPDSASLDAAEPSSASPIRAAPGSTGSG